MLERSQITRTRENQCPLFASNHAKTLFVEQIMAMVGAEQLDPVSYRGWLNSLSIEDVKAIRDDVVNDSLSGQS